MLAHAFFPGAGRGGDVHFDADENWTVEKRQSGYQSVRYGTIHMIRDNQMGGVDKVSTELFLLLKTIFLMILEIKLHLNSKCQENNDFITRCER